MQNEEGLIARSGWPMIDRPCVRNEKANKFREGNLDGISTLLPSSPLSLYARVDTRDQLVILIAREIRAICVVSRETERRRTYGFDGPLFLVRYFKLAAISARLFALDKKCSNRKCRV